jgi:crotonobetainyl-CoA:carnitine CoA-transferase CaiB-like acyl-CoA transferase
VSAPTPGYGLFSTRDGGQVALGVLNEQPFWVNLCRELGIDSLSALEFDERLQRGAELQAAVAGAIATQPRDELVSRLVSAGVPVAPVLDRQGMLESAPFPRFPIRLPLPDVARLVPNLDQHRGQGFASTPDA